ncbi:MAG: PKD domain-containing protein [Thermoplasmata archaeon]|nr:PKD domain-containing protein [Thermoplasmata archaeon]
MANRWAAASVEAPMSRRALSTVVSAVVIVLVLAGLGVGTYAVLGGFSSGTPASCQPVNSPICGQFINLHDVSLLLPFRSVQEGSGVPFTISLPAGESATSYSVFFGDGNHTTSHNSSVSHNYTTAGTYLVQAQATVNGLVHDNIESLALLQVTPAITGQDASSLPSLSGTIIGNTTNPSSANGPTAVLRAGQSVTVNGTYTGQPTNPSFVASPPKLIVTSGGVASNVVNSSAAITGTFTFATPGTYLITFVGSATNATGTSAIGAVTLYQNYTWTAIVPAAGTNAGVKGQTVTRDPHPGTIIAYELAPGGALSEDPAIDYETVGAEPILNVYQPLITYNGSDTGPTPQDFVPVLATCVPGSAQCAKLYDGNTLVNGWNYTFVIQGNASFYDPNTGNHWGVYPTDVVFSIARTMGFATLPSTESNNGWILTQALLSRGNVTWDSIHGAYNNTPANISNSMTINGTDCPPGALNGPDHGCVTFHVYGNNHAWPYFLELIADPLGGSIVPCGWFSAPAQGAGLPFWTNGNVTGSGDHPCGAMGSPGWGQNPLTVPNTGWDQWEQLGSGAFGGTYFGHVQFNMLGSGPYFMSQYLIGASYTLAANPAYGSNPYCTWHGCPAVKGDYAPNVEVTWEDSATQGEDAYLNGVADFASIPSTDFALLIELLSQGKANAINAPTLSVGFFPFDMNFNIGGAQKLTTESVTVQSDWFAYLGMREFFARAYPYQTIENTINTRDGIVLGFNMGGAIPQYMANYYPKDIAWPNTDPCSDSSNVACPSYWWQQLNDPQSPYFDKEATQCTASNPCQLPIVGETGSPALDQELQLWQSEVSTFSGGAIKINPVDQNFVQVVIDAEYGGPGTNPMPVYALGWAPDYPDPTDYVGPLYESNNTYTYGDAVMQSLLTTSFTQGCPYGVTDYNDFANTTWGNNCQGQAYKSMLFALGIASTESNLPYRLMLYDLAEKIAYQLCLYTYTGQSNEVASAASWIDPSSINTNVTIGGGGDAPFFGITGNSLQYPGST